MSFSDVEHFATIISGCESINDGDRSSPDARYAFAVLKLHTVDMGSVAGQEGFLDNVKSGAKKTAEFIKKLFEAIKKWFSETFSSIKGKLSSALNSGDDKERAAKREKLRSVIIPKIEALKTAASNASDGIKTDGFDKAADKAIASLSEGNSAADVVSGMNNLLSEIQRVSNSYVDYCNSRIPKSPDESQAEYDKAVKEYKTWGDKANALTTGIAETFKKES